MLYFLKFSEPLGDRCNKRGQASYYLGYCDEDCLARRLAEHRAGWGAKITAAAVERGIWFEVVLTLPGTRADERRIKKRKNHRRFIELQLKRAARKAGGR